MSGTYRSLFHASLAAFWCCAECDAALLCCPGCSERLPIRRPKNQPPALPYSAFIHCPDTECRAALAITICGYKPNPTGDAPAYSVLSDQLPVAPRPRPRPARPARRRKPAAAVRGAAAEAKAARAETAETAETAAEADGRQCLEHLLAHEERWCDASGQEHSMRELVELAWAMQAWDPASPGKAQAVREALAVRGLRFAAEGLFIECPGWQSLFDGTRWEKGKNADALLGIPGAIRVNYLMKFSPGLGPMPAVLVPLEAVRAALPASVDSASSGQEVQP